MYVQNRLPSFTPLQKYSRTFQLKASVKENKLLSGLIAIGISLFMIFLSYTYIQEFTNYSNAHNKQVIAYNNYEFERAFNFLMNSGIYRLETNKLTDAYSEFKLAYAIHKNNEQLNQLIIETLIILCDNNEKYCNDLEIFLLDEI